MRKRRRVTATNRVKEHDVTEQHVRTKHHRGRRRKRKQNKGVLFLSNLILVLSIIIFVISAYKLFSTGKGYMEGRDEYKKVMDLAVEYEEEDNKFRVDFDKLLEINKDTVGWIRFYPEPTIINYPLVQGSDNSLYLKKTFSANENTLGTIFLDMNCKGDFSGKHTLIYGHRMKDGSMFRKLEEYKDKSFWEDNPYFYIYTPDGKEITYQIYATGVIKDDAKTYTVSFASEEEYQDFLDYTMSIAEYDTGVDVTTDQQVVTLSTCTAASDDHRYVVHGVKIREAYLEE